MGFTAMLLHLVGFVAPALAVALCTTLAARWGAATAGRMRWWGEWMLSATAGSAALLAVMWALGPDGTIAGYAALAACCGTLSWLLSLRAGR